MTERNISLGGDRLADETALEQRRSDVDGINTQLLRLLRKRQIATDDIGAIKARLGMAPLQEDRKQYMMDGLIVEGEEIGLESSYVSAAFEPIHADSVRRQQSARDADSA